MKENLPQKYKDNIFYRFLNKLRAFFYHDKHFEKEHVSTNEFEITKRLGTKNDFAKQIKVDKNIKNLEYERMKFMENLTNNPNLLEEFSSDRLENILQYYLDENNKKRKILAKLNA